MDPQPRPLEQDARGIVDPEALRQVVTLRRYPPGEALAGLVDRFWAVQWDLPSGMLHDQQVLTHPGANLSVGHGEPDGTGTPGPIEAVLHGPANRLTTRRLMGSGWTVAAMTTPGGLGAFVPGSVRALTGRAVPLGSALGRPEPVNRIAAEVDEPARVDRLRDWLVDVLSAADLTRIAAAREVAAVARLAETDRSIRRLTDLAAAAGVTPRSLQRLFAEYAGASPTWVLRRYRILDAAEQARVDPGVAWADLAADLGYSDQAHLVRDFRAHLGTTPAAYAARQPVG